MKVDRIRQRLNHDECYQLGSIVQTILACYCKFDFLLRCISLTLLSD